ncbi:MAG TPA: FAD-dependent oxidoreductase [Solirubrobacteraceae bacterium]|nr:FAD-dependent oxidoreductase [Solirubrobacteraceae bacterium]
MASTVSAMTDGRRRGRARPRVLIAGGGVAGLETLLALRALAGDRVDITLVTPEPRFVNRSMTVARPFGPPGARGVRMQDVTAQYGARWHRGSVDRVEHERRVVVMDAGDELAYDVLVLALGARPGRESHEPEVLTFHDGRYGAGYRHLLGELREGRIGKLAFIRPAGATWPLPLYDLTLMTAADCAAHDRPEIKLSLITPEAEPLAIFGAQASAAVRELLEQAGVALRTSSLLVGRHPGWLDLAPGDRGMPADRIVIEPRLVGPPIRGIPCGRDGFLPTDRHGRLPGCSGVFAAGDATAFPIKQGGLAAQQADAVAEAIAATVGVDIDPQPFRPVLRGVLLTGAAARYLRADISGGAGDDSTISTEPLWWPPNKLCGRYLAPYLSRQTGDGAKVMPQQRDGVSAEACLRSRR